MLFCVSPNVAKADEQVLFCTEEIGSGIVFKNGSWTTGRFAPNRFTLKHNLTRTGGDLTISESSVATEFNCEADILNNALYTCTETPPYGYSFQFNRENGRFVYYRGSPWGYPNWKPSNTSTDTSHVAAGSCVSF